MIQEILITVTPLVEWLQTVVQGVVITVTPLIDPLADWLHNSVNVVITATPDFGGMSLMMVASAFFLIFAMEDYIYGN